MKNRLPILVLLATAWLARPAWGGDHCCPPPSYSCLHYWAPALYRCRAFHRPNALYPADRFPHLPLDFRITHYPCPPVPPEVSAAQYPPPLPGR